MKWDLTTIGIVILSIAIVYFVIVPRMERFDNPSTKVDQPCPPNSVKCPSGDCRIKTDIYGLCD